jgi:hypothetical protein
MANSAPETIAELEDLSLTVRLHQLESRMRESRLSGSEGGGANALPTPILRSADQGSGADAIKDAKLYRQLEISCETH